MKKLLVLIVLFTGIAFFETRADERHYSYGTLFGGFGAVTHSAGIGHFGGGLGTVYKSGMGFSAEAGYLFSFGNPEGVLNVDVNANYHLLNATPTRQLVPFFGGGYSWLVGHRFNFGGGIDYWIKPRTAIRFEVRDHLLGETNAVGIRAGFVFR